jgi:hypothetical protein
VRVLDVIWPWIGPVKRAQAMDVLSRADELPVRRRHHWRDQAALFVAAQRPGYEAAPLKLGP